MKQPIAGVSPAELSEVTQMEVWPSISATQAGRFLGTGYAIRWPDFYIFRLGNLIALLTIPIALALYFYRLVPCIMGLPLHGVWYRLTNRRVIVVRNEIRIGQASSLLRTLAGVNTILVFGIIFAILFFGVYGGEWPASSLGNVLLGVFAVATLAGFVPIFADVPFPRFSFAVETKSVALDRFDEIEINVRPGQAWFAAGDLIFRREGVETFRLDGVLRPEAFRQVLTKARSSYVGVQEIMRHQTAAV